MKTIRELQTEISVWSDKNFGTDREHRLRITALGILEECGEFVHAIAKSEHGRRGGTPEYWEGKKKDAIGDCMIFLLDHCTNRDWDLGALLYGSTFKEVQDKYSHPTNWLFLGDLMKAAVWHWEEEMFIQSDALDTVSNWAAYCDEVGWDLQEIVEKTWDNVRTRDMSKRIVTT